MKDGMLFCDTSGAIVFNVVYLSDSSEVESHSFTSEFNDSIKIDSSDVDSESVFAFVSPFNDNCQCKVQSPRRISVRTDLCLVVDIRANKSFECYTKGKDSAETRERQTTVLREICSKDAEFKVNEEIRLPKHCPPMERILSACISVSVDHVTSGDNSISFVGNADISCVYIPEIESEKGICSFYQPLGVRGSVEVDDSRGDMVSTVRLVPSSFSYEISSDDLGESRILKVNIAYTAQCLVEENSQVTLTEDAYGVGCALTPSYCTSEFKRYVGTLREENAIKEKIPLKKDIKALEGTVATANIKNTFFEKGELYADCRINVSAIGITDELPCSVSESIDAVIHLNLPSEVSGYSDELIFDVDAVTGFVDTRVDEGNAGLSFDVTVTAQIYRVENALFVASAEIGATVSRDEKRVFCYPSEEDTLWSVGKRYGVGVQALAEANSMTADEPLKRVMRIPCGEAKASQ